MKNKYERPLDKAHFNSENSQEKIIMQIAPGSKILECGCATGYMTRYMRDELGCSVSIVEYDEAAYQIARQYANDGICADLMQSGWLEYFNGQKFDYILFADVLEHLYDPQAVLKKATALLCEDGYILASIPNVAHGDILANLWEGSWAYTEVGLLDKAHIRFFAKNNLEEFWKMAGFTIVRLDYTFCALGKTEQSEQNLLGAVSEKLRDALKRRDDSTIYQFIIAAQRSKYVEQHNIPFTRAEPVKSRKEPVKSWKQAELFFRIEDRWSAENSITVPYILDDFQQRFDLDKIQIDGLRFDPLDAQCVVFSICVQSDAGELEIYPSNGYRVGQIDIFTTGDPQYRIDLAGTAIKWIDIQAKIVPMPMGRFQNVIEGFIHQFKAMESELSRKRLELEQREKELTQSKEEAAQAQRELERNKYVFEREIQKSDEQHTREIESIGQQYMMLENEKVKIQQTLMEQEQLLNGILNSFSFKITRPLYNIKTALYFAMEKRPLTQRIRKAISLWRRRGLRELVRELAEYRKRKRCLNMPKQAPTGKEAEFLIYDAEYQADRDFANCSTDVKALAFYLPQFHTFPENDAWWGKGFTEWTNVKKGAPRFEGHYQPRTPHKDIGYYCLENIEVMRRQAELAKRHGIYGFCFYYYWFSGKRLMEKPVDMLLDHPEIDIPFCLCWANENWTRRWDGQEQDVLIKQEYSDEDDEIFIIDLKKYLNDPRYIRINGKPVIIVYSPYFIPDCRKSFQKWREVARKIGVGEIQIWICLTWGKTSESMQLIDCVDAEVEFPPHNLGGEWLEIPNVEREGKDTIIYDYQRAVNYITSVWEATTTAPLPIHYSCMMAWDNAARRKNGWHAFYHFSLKSFYHWVSEAARQARARLPEEERFIFINAWNEWGEGTYLEPDAKYGYANINTAAKAIFGLPFELDTQVVDESCPTMERNTFQENEKTRIAVQAHIFYVELLDEIVEQLNYIPYSFDLFITTDTEKKKTIIQEFTRNRCNCRKVDIQVLPNRGRDVASFLIQMAPEIDNYEYIGHIHTKKTVTSDYGDRWRDYLFHNLLGSTEYLKRLFSLFEADEKLGIIMPELYPPIREQTKWTGEYAGVRALLDRIGFDGVIPEQMTFPAGNMFWARTAAVRSLFALGLKQTDFPEEAGQRYGTLAHQIERSWVYVAEAAGYGYCNVLNSCENKAEKNRR